MSSLLEKITNSFINISVKEKLLLACSGGRDSVALFHSLVKLKIPFSVAHCNFQLRGEESDEDARFVGQLCEKHNVEFHLKTFDTNNLKESRESTQMLARRLRYTWFEELLISENLTYLAVAHHQDDQIESFFIELSRGNGLKGLSGMDTLNGNVFRPMLKASGDEVQEFVKDHNILFREDSSNSSSNYLRNRFRNEILPLLANEIEIARISDTMLKLQDAQHAISYYAKNLQLISEGFQNKKSLQEIPIQVLIEALTEYGFKINQIRNLQTSATGASFNSETHQINVGAMKVVFNVIRDSSISQVLNDGTTLINNIRFEVTTKVGSLILKEASSASFDADKLLLPLRVRNWKRGDKFKPFGMKGEKKLSDFFIDLKFNNWEKQNQLIVEDAAGKIIWIVGKRTSELVKVTHVTKKTVIIVTN